MINSLEDLAAFVAIPDDAEKIAAEKEIDAMRERVAKTKRLNWEAHHKAPAPRWM